MRLSYLKLSGFKSFVDPTTLHFPGELVGIVGPNGCGKSNVIDAVRWVLGESKASELRGESMQDVIFSGAGTRKPSGRASVELVFENNAGRITGPWAQYSEISVKRILTRDGQSTYWINNQAVRRKDVYDLFMGTGLGPRAYAIIGQGMISRVIESRPEELRVFLEEAAGVSKYRERRKETEGRLSDTRENLARIEDIRLELEGRITQLENQAELAQRFNEISSRRDERQRWLWWTRREDYVQSLEKLKTKRQAIELDMEAQLTQLRSLERQIEEARTGFHQASDDVHHAQAALFETNTEITKIEAEQRRLNENRERAHLTREQSRQIMDAETQAIAQGEEQRAKDIKALAALEADIGAKKEASSGLQATLSPLEQALLSRNESLTSAQADAASAQAELRALSERQTDISGRLRKTQGRIEELESERKSIERVDPSARGLIQKQREEAQSIAQASEAALTTAEAEIEKAVGEQDRLMQEVQAAKEALAQTQAELIALQSLQSQVDGKDQLKPWLSRQGMDRSQRLWDRIRVKDGWMRAVEAVLADRLGAIEVGSLSKAAGFKADLPPARLTVFSARTLASKALASDSLAHQVSGEGAVTEVMKGWLAQVHCCDDLADAIKKAENSLELSECWVTKEGHIVNAQAVRFYAPEDLSAGILERRLRIEELTVKERGERLVVEETALTFNRAELNVRERRQALIDLREKSRQSQARSHELELALLKIDEKIQRLSTQDASVASLLETLRLEAKGLETELAQCTAAFEAADARLSDQQQEAEEQRSALDSQQTEVQSARAELQSAERALQEAILAHRLAQEQQKSFEEAQARSRARLAEAGEKLAGAEQELLEIQKALDSSAVQPLLDQRIIREQALAEVRERADQLSQQLRALDESRMVNERALEPLRAAISQIDADLSGARVGIEQIEEQMSDADAKPEAISESLALAFPDGKYPKPSTLHAEVQRLTKEIESIGPVNLAALSELEQSRERKAFLDSQAADLLSAVETLEDAIRKIDRETRSLLQETFDAVNTNFGALFPRLFGGGEAKLVMTGEEILDCGVQVMAQPPGKRNTSIHLLSGGEKALTATALVFALFQLNPAPFCLLDEVDAPLDDPNTERFCNLVRHMSTSTQFIFITHNKIAMEMAQHLMGVTMQEQGVSRVVAVDLDAANAIAQEAA